MGLVRQACGVRDTTRKTTMEEPPAPGPVGPKPRVVRSKTRKATAKKTPAKKATRRNPAGSAKTKSDSRSRGTTARAKPAAAQAVEQRDEALLAAFAKALDQALVA
jgi:hypothetical protein